MTDYSNEKGFGQKLLDDANNVCAAIFKFMGAVARPVGKVLHHIFIGEMTGRSNVKEVNS